MKTTEANIKINKKSEEHNVVMRFSNKVATALKNEVTKLNKQKKGTKRITTSDILEILLPTLNDQQRDDLLSRTITSINRQEVAFKNYSKKHRNINKDDFLDLIQYGEIQINDYLPPEMRKNSVINTNNSTMA